MTNWDNPYVVWYEYHKEDYQAVKQRLAACRNVLLHGRKDAAAELLEKAAVNSILSIQTDRERHERAFTAYYGSDMSIQAAAEQTVYGNQKGRWLVDNQANCDWKELVNYIRGQVFADNAVAAVGKLQDEVTGLSWVKGGFTLAMCGLWEVACPDSRTRQELDMDGDRGPRNKLQYVEALDEIDSAVPIGEPLFIKQWTCYDVFAGEHADHMPFFTEALNLYELDGF